MRLENIARLVFVQIHDGSIQIRCAIGCCRCDPEPDVSRQRARKALRSARGGRVGARRTDVGADPVDDLGHRSAGVKIRATPNSASDSRSASGIIPPPNTTMSAASASRSNSITLANSVRWAPERTDSPIPSASSAMAVCTICSGLWCRPV